MDSLWLQMAGTVMVSCHFNNSPLDKMSLQALLSGIIFLLFLAADVSCSTSVCEQVCAVIDGIETCFCEAGYEIASDNTTCMGEYLTSLIYYCTRHISCQMYIPRSSFPLLFRY